MAPLPRAASRHGILAKQVVLESESRRGFETLLREHVARLGPGDAVEEGFIEEMVSSLWRMRRIWAIETHSIENAIDSIPAGNSLDRLTGALAKLAEGPQLSLIHRYETRLHRIYQRALHNLLLLQTLPVPNEPNPISEHCDVIKKEIASGVMKSE